jgi:hypothetical protein
VCNPILKDDEAARKSTSMVVPVVIPGIAMPFPVPGSSSKKYSPETILVWANTRYGNTIPNPKETSFFRGERI